METDMVHKLTATFEAHTQQTENGVEFWLARDLQHLLGYAEWRNFTTVISKAKIACEVSGHSIEDHFVDVNKMVDLGSGSRREVDDIMLTRYACATSSLRTAIQESRRSLLLKPTLPYRLVVRNSLNSVYWKQSGFLHVKN